MHIAAAVLATLLVAVLVLVVPVLGRRRYPRLKLQLRTDSGARLRHYRTSIIREWAIVGVVLLIGLLSGYSLHAIGLFSSSRYRFDSGQVIYYLVVFVIALVLGQVILLRRTSQGRFGMAAPLRGAVDVLPRTDGERKAFVAVRSRLGSVRRSCTEDSDLPLSIGLSNASSAVAVVVTSVAFGVAPPTKVGSGRSNDAAWTRVWGDCGRNWDVIGCDHHSCVD